MPQIINPGPSLGYLLGTGLGSGLQQLAQNKLGEMQARSQQARVSQGLSALGIPAQEAHQIASLPEQLQGLVVKNYLAAAESKGLDEALSSLRGEPAQHPLQNTMSPQEPSAQLMKSTTPQQKMQPSQKSPEIPSYTSPEGMEKGAENFADLLKRSRLSPQDKLKVESLRQARDLHKEKLSAKEQELVNKETKPVYDEISKGAKSAQNNNKRLDRMETLVKKGNLVGSLWGSLLETATHGIFGLGIDLHSLLHPDSQEFRKLSSDFLKDAKDTFGSRLTNYDVKTFLSTVPTLSQSDAGKLRVIRNLRSFNEAALARKKALDDIIKENGGRRPANLDTLVEERVSPLLDSLATKFKEGVPSEEESERTENKSWLVPEALRVR